MKQRRTKSGNRQVLGGGKTKRGVPFAFSAVEYNTPKSKMKKKTLLTVKLKVANGKGRSVINRIRGMM